MAAYVYHNMGRLMCLAGDFLSSVRFYERAIGFWEKAYGKENELTARSYEGLAYTLYHGGNHREAKKIMNKARDIYSALYGNRDERVKAADEFLKTVN